MDTERSGALARPVRRVRRFPHVPALDGVRGLAAVAVLLHHCLYTSSIALGMTLRLPVVQWATGYFYLGVDLFFVLSGYLITTLLLLARRDPAYYPDFYWKRAFRILPALLLVLALVRILFHAPWSGVVVALLFVTNFARLLGAPAIGPFWSLAIEEHFYLSSRRSCTAPVPAPSAPFFSCWSSFRRCCACWGA